MKLVTQTCNNPEMVEKIKVLLKTYLKLDCVINLHVETIILGQLLKQLDYF